ncbi:aspartate-semialdehyde dehydrogenase [Enterobacteriaceae endosymbiont of Macroplea appendiculata]|uniref:aspartate-semialdehyde dehydrogenase n=1 Tax=Enterobacteriaceae endosymbiont of Macroplea appendiculata TaxID=2675790 RepID=UPI001B3AC567|nr:aspartate-semialdehyde dehydrogenase [Enterobacteriaceae endosymbiont of Macroplea appendiculata]
MMKNIGFAGWRGIVGSVLLKRMLYKNDFHNTKIFFLTTSQVGEQCPQYKNINIHPTLQDAYNLQLLLSLDIIITCQGSEYTRIVYHKLHEHDWKGYWIDAASYLRSLPCSCIVLDPINLHVIKKKIDMGIKTFVGGNCTVSLMLMALGELFKQDMIKWVFVSTYQAISGAGTKFIQELLLQNKFINDHIHNIINDNTLNILKLERKIASIMQNELFPKKHLTIPLINNVIPWIDQKMNNGQTKEEWKGQFETNKILDNKSITPIDGICVRVPTLRSHSQSFMIKLKTELSINNITELLQLHNKWVKIIPNDYTNTKKYLTPQATNNTLNVAIGRIKKLNIDKNCFSAFTVGDQLLWGAAEPLRRIFKLLTNII